MNQVTDVTDVEFKEVPAVQDPVEFLTQALRNAGYADPEGWKIGLHPAASTAATIGERLFLVNRSLGLYLSEVKGRGDNIVPRMFISGALNFEQWKQVIVEGVAAWLMEQFDLKTGKRIAPPTVFTPGDSEATEDDSAIGLNLVSTEDADRTVRVIQPELSDEQKFKIIHMTVSMSPDELDITPTLKVRNIHRGGGNAVEFQDLSNSEQWFPLSLESLTIERGINEKSMSVVEGGCSFEVNQTVVLKSGGPLMLATAVNGDDVTCTWPDADGVTQEAVFPKATLSYPRGETTSFQHTDEAGYVKHPQHPFNSVAADVRKGDDGNLEVIYAHFTEDAKTLIRHKLAEGGEFTISTSGGINVRNTIINGISVLESNDAKYGDRWYPLSQDALTPAPVAIPQTWPK